MGAAGTSNPTGGAPRPDPERVATIRYTLVDEPETCAAFGESVRATLASLNDRTLAETRSGDLGECGMLLDHIRDRVGGLDPARLEPRGLFDSRGRRLKAFRAAYASAASAVTQTAADLGDRAGALARKDAALETLWSETRDAIAELDAHIAAARSWLANEAPPVAPPEPEAPVVDSVAPEFVEEAHERCEAQADAEALHAAETASGPAEGADAPPTLPEAGDASASAVVPEEDRPVEDPVAAIAEPSPVAALPHPLVTRLAVLEAVRAIAIGRLPLLRAAQNADCRAPASLKQVCDGVEAWRAEWLDALGLAGRRPKKVRPDRVRLETAASALADRIEAARRELSAAQARRAELEARAVPTHTAAQLAA